MKNKTKVKILSILLAALLTGGIGNAMTAEAQEKAALAGTTQLNVNVRYGQSEARSMLGMLNTFRTGDEAWYWNEDNSSKQTANLSELAYDYNLEQIAMQRAAEIAVSFSHTRPDGTKWSELTYSGVKSNGENIAAGSTTAEDVFEGWKESDQPYSGQGHRRNMLSNDFKAVGIGHVYVNGCHYWVQEFGSSVSGSSSETAPKDSDTAVSVDVSDSNLTSVTVSVEGKEEYALSVNDSINLPAVTLTAKVSGMWPSGGSISERRIPDWRVDDPAVAEISGGQIVGKQAGKTSLTAEVLNKTVSVPVTVIEKKPEIPGVSGNCGDNVFWEYDSQGKVLTISGSSAMVDYEDGFDLPWEESVIQTIVIEEGVTEVGSYAFSHCGVQNIQLPEGIVRIGDFAFEGCHSLERIKLPASLTELGQWVFSDCKSLSAIDVDSGSHTYCSDDGVLYNKEQTVLVAYPAGKSGSRFVVPSQVVKIGDAAFLFCEQLSQIVLHDQVEEIGNDAFWDCGIAEIYLGKNLKRVGDCAFGLTKLTEATLLSRIEWGEGVFSRCSCLTRAEVEEGIAAIPARTFENCISLAAVSLPSSLLAIEHGAFEDTGLKNLVLPKKVKTIGSRAFYQSEYMESIVIPASVEEIGEDVFRYSGKLTVKCYPDTAGYRYARDNNIPYELLTVSGGGGNGDTGSQLKVEKISLSGPSKQIAAGKKIKLTARVYPANASNKAVVWKSGNPKVATVNASGVVTVKKKTGGKSVTITAVAADGSGVSASYKLKSMQGVVKKISISGKKSVKAGKSLKLKAKVAASKKANKKLKWTSSNTKYAKVSNSGKVTARKAGKGKKVKITAMATDGSKVKKSITIRIK